MSDGFKVESADALFERWYAAQGINASLKELLRRAFVAAFHQSRNYVCDAEVYPEIAVFANGRLVKASIHEGNPVLYVKTMEPQP